MRQIPLLSLSAWGCLASIVSCTDTDGLQPIVEVRDQVASVSAAGSTGSAGSSGAAGTIAASAGHNEGKDRTGREHQAGVGGDQAASNDGAQNVLEGGSTGSGGTSDVAEIATGTCEILPNEDGFVAASSNVCGVQGFWYSYSDCTTSADDCTSNLQPPEHQPFPNENGEMCTSGTTASVTSSKEFDSKWGAGIGLSLNQGFGETKRGRIGDLQHALIGFKFALVGDAIPDEVRVNFPTPQTTHIEHFSTIGGGAGEYKVLFDDLHQGDWVDDSSPLDVSQITAIQFQVPAKSHEEVSFDYCVQGLTALYSSFSS